MKDDPLLYTMRVLRTTADASSGSSGMVGAVTATSVTTLTRDDTNVNEANHVVATPISASVCLRHFTLRLTSFISLKSRIRILKIIGFVDKLIQSQE